MRELFKIGGFTPYILIVFLNSMTDLGHKIVIQNTIFKTYSGAELIILTAVVNSLILLPFILLFVPAGFLSDKYPKTQVIKVASFIAIIITSLILLGYIMGWFWFAFGMTLLLAGQSAIYAPAKYGLIKEMVGDKRLTEGNAIVQSVTIISILAGAVLYSIFFEALLNGGESSKGEIFQAIYPLGFALIGASTLEFLLSLQLTRKVRIDGGTKFSTMEGSLKIIREKRVIWLSIIGLSIFWGISQLVVAIFGEYLKEHMGVDNTIIAQGLLSISGVGMVAGSLFVGFISRESIEVGIVPIGALGIALTLLSISNIGSLLLFGVLFFFYGFFFGFVIVPLNALIQYLSPHEVMGKILAGNSFMQNLFMFLFLILSALFAYMGLSSSELFTIATLIAFGSFLYSILKLPHQTIKFLVGFLLRLKYKLSIQGLKAKEFKGGVLLLGNHISFLDWAILQIAYPKQIRFVIDREYYNLWYFKPIFKFFRAIPISSRGGKNALSQVSEALDNGDTVALFPEGNISRNGHLGRFHKGFEIALSNLKSEDIVIIPFYIRGLWEGKFSYASNELKRRDLRDIGIIFGEPISPKATASDIKMELFRLSAIEWQSYIGRVPTIPKSWIVQAKRVGNRISVADSTGVELSGYRFLTAVLLMRSRFKREFRDSSNIGLILPSTAGGAIGNMALLTLGKRVVNLNYSSGEDNLKYSIELAEIKYIVTSRRFLSRLKSKGFNLERVLEGVNTLYMEDIKDSTSKPMQLLTYLMVKLFPTKLLSLLFVANRPQSDTAVIMFSSGSEGKPKGIELSHTNIMGNVRQVFNLLNPSENDILLGTLPIFHSFGFTVTTILPLVEGIPLVSHPDPTDGYGIAKLSLKYRATILFGTATFYRLYAKNRKIHPLMFESLKMVVAGAEPLPRETKELFKMRFGKEILEGYGTTETSPVASCNLHDKINPSDFHIQIGNKEGSVGLPLVGTVFKVIEPETSQPLPIGEAGMLLIGGVQVMKGYIKNRSKSDEVLREEGGIRWYITGDKGYIDSDGFVTIVDRYSRFAKIGGEMISLGYVEREINRLLDESSQVAVTAIPDSKKGERLVLILEGDMDLEELKQLLKGVKLNPLHIPNEHFKVEALPKLGSGKSDYKGLKKLALDLC